MEHETPWGIVAIAFDNIENADPDSGIFSAYVTDWWITHVGGRACSLEVSEWLRKRLDCDTIECRILEENL